MKRNPIAPAVYRDLLIDRLTSRLASARYGLVRDARTADNLRETLISNAEKIPWSDPLGRESTRATLNVLIELCQQIADDARGIVSKLVDWRVQIDCAHAAIRDVRKSARKR